MKNVSAKVDVVMADGEPDHTPLAAGQPDTPEQADVSPDLTTPAGMVAAARAGDPVVIARPSHTEGRDAFDEMVAHAGDAVRVSRANGRERIDFKSGGHITIAPREGN